MLNVYHYQIEEVSWLPWRQLFDVDEENNLPTWFSGALLALAAGCLWLLRAINGKSGTGRLNGTS
jgi:hypothetical protein